MYDALRLSGYEREAVIRALEDEPSKPVQEARWDRLAQWVRDSADVMGGWDGPILDRIRFYREGWDDEDAAIDRRVQELADRP